MSSIHLKVRSLVLILFMVVGAFFEVVSISLVLPFIAILSSPDIVYNYVPNSLKSFIISIDHAQLTLIITGCSISAIVIAGVFRFLLAFYQLRLAYDFGSEFRTKLFDKTLRQELTFFETNGPSLLVSQVHDKVEGVVHHFIIPLLNIMFSIVVLIIAFLVCLKVAPEITLLFSISLIVIYSSILFFSRRFSQNLSYTINALLPNLILYLRDSYGAVRQILLTENYREFVERYSRDEKVIKDANLYLNIIAISPRFFIETTVIVGALSLSFYLNANTNNFIEYIPVFGTAVLAFQRLFPIIQQMYAGISSLRGSTELALSVKQCFDTAHTNLELYDRDQVGLTAPIRSFGLDSITFSYAADSQCILERVTHEFRVGRYYGIVGQSGCGKSTFVDCLMGLLRPAEGHLLSDQKKVHGRELFSWRRHIAHVPQDIFLLNADIACNVAFTFNTNKIDLLKVHWALNMACLLQDINELPNGIKTYLGENGSNLSGGQKQRIGLARAFYLNRPILILDEATSALDIVTEKNIMDNLKKYFKGRTVITITHRFHSLEYCDSILEIKKGHIVRETTYPEFIKDI